MPKSKFTADAITRCLSIRQPFAWAVVAGYKSVENRNTPTPFRGRIAIHASQAWGYNEDDFPEDADPFYDKRILKAIGGQDGLCGGNRLFTRSAIIGSVMLSEVYSPADLIVFTDDRSKVLQGESRLPRDQAEWAAGGGYWIFSDARVYTKPIRCDGKLNLWFLPADLQRKVADAEAAAEGFGW